MIYRKVAEIEPGAVVSRPVHTGDGRVLLKPGSTLTERYLEMLKRRGVEGVYVLLGEGEGTRMPAALSGELRASASAAVGRVQRLGRSAGGRAGARSTDEVYAWFASPIGQRAAADFPKADVGALAIGIVDEVLAAASEANLRVDKSLGDYNSTHSVDVATIAVAIAKRIGLQRDSLVDLARGCLLHDVGMTLVSPEIVNKPGPLTADERAQIELHPRLGFEMLRNLQPEAVVPNHVALQHHERQDGSGYPGGLRGQNRVRRSPISPDRGEIAGLAEIAAVADVYDALSSHRPYRRALPDDKVRATLRALAPAKLNQEAVEALLAVVPVYPVGGRVTLICRQYPRHLGLIVRRNKEQPNRPVVRIYGDADGAPVEPIELDLQCERGILIRPAV
jgi:putative nucleotidyltransferase with HDIG domain